MNDKSPGRPRSLARRINGIVSACIVVFFLAHGLLGSTSAITGYKSPLTWLVWVGVGCIVAHVILSAITSHEQLTDTVRPISDKKRRHLILKWVTGTILAVVAAVHIVVMVTFGSEAVQTSATGVALAIALAIVLATHISVGAKSLLKDLGVDRRWRNTFRIVVCVAAAAIGIIALLAALM